MMAIQSTYNSVPSFKWEFLTSKLR